MLSQSISNQIKQNNSQNGISTFGIQAYMYTLYMSGVWLGVDQNGHWKNKYLTEIGVLDHMLRIC